MFKLNHTPFEVGWGQNVWPNFDFVAAGGILVSQTRVLFTYLYLDQR